MKTIFFLRHGQTQLNKQLRHQFDNTPLSEKGRVQVARIAEKLRGKGIEKILTSTQARAKQTAEIVSGVLGVAVEENALFTELRRPSALHGISWLTPQSLFTMGMLYMRAGDKKWHSSDEENLHEFHSRVRKGLEYLTSQKEETILVVTHRGVISTAMLQMHHDGMDTTAQYRKTLRCSGIGNACYVKATWSPEGEGHPTLTGTWRVGA
jgi:broad specificity phosphatase PhoE